MGRLIDIDLLPPAARAQAEAILKVQDEDRWKPTYLMTYQECAEMYGYEYDSIKYYTCKGWLKATRTKGKRPAITHADMQVFLKSRKQGRRPYGRPAQAVTPRPEHHHRHLPNTTA